MPGYTVARAHVGLADVGAAGRVDASTRNVAVDASRPVLEACLRVSSIGQIPTVARITNFPTEAKLGVVLSGA